MKHFPGAKMEICTLLFLFLTFIINLSLACPPQCHACDGGVANCLGAGLRDIPKTFHADVTAIDMTNNQITVLDSRSFQELPNVSSLRMSGNGINTIGAGALKKLPSLRNLDLSGNPLSTIHNKAFKGLDNLVTLSLSNNDLRHIGKQFQETPNLSSLILGYNKLQELEDDDFEKNTRIRMLDLSNNRIAVIHSNAFKNLKMLRYLMLNNNPIGLANDLSFSSSMLQLVDFTNCQLQEVPRTIPPSVADLRLGNNRITEIREYDFQNVSNLRLVTLNNNKINLVAYKAFKPLDHLMEIWLSHNKMIYIPRGLPSNLTKIYMDHNLIFDIESQHFGPNSKLELLSLEMSQVTTIPEDAFTGLEHLKQVNLQGNNIRHLKSQTFADLPSLETLQLSNNPLEIIEPETFKNLPNLTTLSMSYIRSAETSVTGDFLSAISRVNNLQFVFSPGIVKSLMSYISRPRAPIMSGVRSVTLQYNDLQTLPENVKNVFENIQKILLDGNNWHCDKQLIWLRDWLRSSDILFYENEPLVCQTPLNVNGDELTDLQNDDFAEVSIDVETVQSVPTELESNSQTQPSRGDTNFIGTNVIVRNPLVTTSTTPRPMQKPKKKKLKRKKGKKRKKKRKNKKRKNRKLRKRKKKDGRKKRRIGRGRKKRCRTKDGKVVCRRRRKKLRKNSTPTESSPVTV